MSAASQMGSGVLVSPVVRVTESGGLVTVTVTGRAEQLVPGIPVSVSASASAPLEGLPANPSGFTNSEASSAGNTSLGAGG